MVFQDFDMVRERRRQERLRKLKRRIAIAVVILVVAGIVAVAVFAFMSTKDDTKSGTKKNDGDGKKDDNKPKDNKPPATTPSTPPTTTTPSVPKGPLDLKEFVQFVCNGSTYKILCSTALTKNLEKNPDSMKQPKQLVKLFITSTNEELNKALAKAGTIGLKTEADKKAFGVCQELIGDAKEELQSAAGEAEKIDTAAKQPTNGDLSAQLSAVMSYQEACVDGFPEGQTKNDFKTNFNTSQVYTSNSLAMVKQLPTLVELGNNKNNNTNNNKNNNTNTTNTNAAATNNNNKNTNTTTTTNNNNNKNNPNPTTTTTNNKNNINPNPNPNPNTNTNNNNNNNNNNQAKRNVLQTGLPSWLNIEQHRELKEEGESKLPTPNVTVSQDDSGKFKTISEALAAMPKKYDGRYVIFVKAGTYVENVIVTEKMVNLTIYGEGSQKSIITGTKNTADGIPLYLTPTFVAAGRGFMARAIGFRNTAGPDKQQALSARISSDKSIFLNCRFEGYANTLYAQTHRQFYKSCVIKGTVDFIFGDAAAVFQNCEIYVRKPKDNQKNTVTAQTRKDEFETTGIVIQSSKIMADETFKADAKRFKSYLGRPTKKYSRTIVIETQIDEFIDPAGWLEFEGQKDFGLDTILYGEFKNTGPGAKTAGRVKWAGRKDINKDEAMKYTVGTFLQGSWIKETGAPVSMELGS